MTRVQPTDINKYITTIRINFENAYKTQTDEEREILIRSWFAILKEYPKEVCDKAVLQAIKYAKFAPRIGDIVEQIEKMQIAYEKTEAELWETLTGVLPEVGRLMYFGTARSYYNGRLIDPITEVNKIYDKLDPLLQEFVGGVSGLVALSKQETLDYEKGRFLKTVPQLRTRAKTRRETSDQLAGLIQGLSGQVALPCDRTKLLKES